MGSISRGIEGLGRGVDRLRTVLAVTSYEHAARCMQITREQQIAPAAVSMALAQVDVPGIIDHVVGEISNDGTTRTQGVLIRDVAHLAVERFSQALMPSQLNNLQGEPNGNSN